MKNVVITGSTRGIGLAMAREFLQSGCQVTLSGRGEALPESLLTQLAVYGEHYHYVPCNVQDMGAVELLWSKAAAKWGKIDIWINNAGQNSPHEFSYKTDTACINAVIDTNIKGMIFGSQVAARQMLLQGSGQIWNMEGLGSNDMIQVKTILYGTTKHALTYFTKGLARELQGTGVCAGRLSPGMMLTDFITKSPDGNESPVIRDKKFQFIFNTLADRPEIVAAFFVPQMISNTRNNAQLVWLTGMKAVWRFLTRPFARHPLLGS